MALQNEILDYYFRHQAELPNDKKLHFGTRIAAWTGDPRAYELLNSTRPFLLPATPLRNVLNELIISPPSAPINAFEKRKKYFQEFPRLRGVDFALFRVRHLLQVLGIDAREELMQVISLPELQKLRQELISKPDALSVLSTYAINFLYLLWHLYDIEKPNPRDFLQLGATFGNEPEDLQLKIYLYTHCIIGATNFYVLTVKDDLQIYEIMLNELEEMMASNLDHINLDCKLEFLVANRIIGRSTPLYDAIQNECERSVSEHGYFLIDTHNEWAKKKLKTSFVDSEHRNVLFIMSQTPFNPHSTLV